MNYLRDVHGIPIGAVEFRYFEDEKREYFTTYPVGSEDIREIEKRELTPSEKRNQELFEDLLSDFKSRHPGVTSRKARGISWVQIPTGHLDIHFEWLIHRDTVEVGLHIESDNKEWNQKVLHLFQQNKDELNAGIGQELQFEVRRNGWARIFIERDRSNLDDLARKWMKDIMEMFYKNFKPIIDKLKETDNS
jgi:hypothetical protein